MPPQFLFDLSQIDLTQVAYGPDAIREMNPHRGEMEMLNGVIWVDQSKDEILGYKDVGANEFWVAGHIPGRPLFPGVLMIETSAQLASFYTKKFIGWKGFVGFGAADKCRFRAQVVPGQRLLVLAKKIWERHRRIYCQTQGLVDGQLVFEGDIVGTQM
jgi:3-hydroxyacyl-[acyl-carrier-protein] dehydratase